MQVALRAAAIAGLIASILADGAVAKPPETPRADARQWKASEEPVFVDPDDDWAKDPSVIHEGDTWYMYYTSANPWQGDGSGGRGEPRIDYATSPDGLKWKYEGVAIPKGQPGQWDSERPQAPAKPIQRDGLWYLYYAGAGGGRGVTTGYATSTDLRHWTKPARNPVLGQGKVNDPFVRFEDGVCYLYYTSGGDAVFCVTSKNLVDWSPPVATGAVGEGSIVLKDGPTYTLYACVGWSHKGEYYKWYTSQSPTTGFVDRGRIKINQPAFAAHTLSHGDIVRVGDEYWFYFQGTFNVGRSFRIGLAKQPVPTATDAKQ